MDIYEGFKVFAMVLCVMAVLAAIIYCLAVYLFCRNTRIDPIVCHPKRTHKFPKIDISVAYQGAKVGQVLSGRK